MKIISFLKRGLSAALCLVLTASLCPPVAFAELCPHHTEHGDCGYSAAIPATPCGHVCGEDCAESCIHSHDELCGYSEGRPEFPCMYICTECLADRLPGYSPDGGEGGQPQLPELPGLPEQPELPELPELPEQPEIPPSDGEGGSGETLLPGSKSVVVSDVELSRSQYDTRLLGIDDYGNLVFGALAIPPSATDTESGAYVPGRFNWGDGAAPLVILNEPGTAEYPLFFVPNDPVYAPCALTLRITTTPYTPAVSTLPIGYIAAMMMSGGSTGINECSIAVISDCDTVYLDGMISKFRTTLKPLSGQELKRLLADNSATGNITIDATYSGYRVDNIQLSAYTLSSFMDAMRDGESGLETLTVKLSGGAMRFDLAALESLCTNDGCSSVRLAMDRDVGTFPLSEQQKDVLRDKNVRLVSRFYFDCQRSEEPLDDYGEGRVDISLPFYYDAITLYAMDDEGNLTELEKSFENMELKFTVSEGSIFVLVK